MSENNNEQKIRCPYCGEEILSQAIKCKHCGEFLQQLYCSNEEQSPNRFIYAFSIICILVGIILFIWGDIIDDNFTNVQQKKFTLLEAQPCSDDYFVSICGKIQNNTKETIDFVSVSFDLLDSEGSVVGEAIDVISSLGPNQIWRFNADFAPDSNIRSYKLKEIDGQ